jgi:hypothetical protein
MNNLSFKKIATATGLFLGAFTFSALAVDWTPPPAGCTAPACNTAAPINVSTIAQHKEGNLAIGKSSDPATGFDLDVGGNTKISGYIDSGNIISTGINVSGLIETIGLKVGGPNASNLGYVLTNDGNGNAVWNASASGITLSEVRAFSVNVLRNGGLQKTTTPTPYLFCALTRVESEMSRVDAGGSPANCQVTKNVDGKWEVSGSILNDPPFTCQMTCFK